jgi:hypothetical protein
LENIMPGAIHIRDYDRLVAWLGHDPSFHDFEVVGLSFDRTATPGGAGPRLLLAVHAFTTSSEVTPAGYFRTANHAIVSFEFYGVSEARLSNFNTQNVLAGLILKDISGTEKGLALHVTLSTSYGLEGSFKCASGAIAAITPGIPPGSVYEHAS